MEEKVLFNVLKDIWRNKNTSKAPDKEYLKALETIGMIKIDWDTTLTDLGHSIYESLQYKIEKY